MPRRSKQTRWVGVCDWSLKASMLLFKCLHTDQTLVCEKRESQPTLSCTWELFIQTTGSLRTLPLQTEQTVDLKYLGWIFFFLTCRGIEPRTLHMLGKLSLTEQPSRDLKLLYLWFLLFSIQVQHKVISTTITTTLCQTGEVVQRWFEVRKVVIQHRWGSWATWCDF